MSPTSSIGDLLRAVSEAPVVSPASRDGWGDDPIPLDPSHGPDLDPSILPVSLRETFEQYAEDTQVPLATACGVGLGVLATAIAPHYNVFNGLWEEPTNLMIMVVSPPASNKSAIVRNLNRPLVEFEASANEQEADARRHWESKRNVLQRQLAAAESDAANSSSEDSQRLHAAAVDELGEHDKNAPRFTQLFSADTTMEAMVTTATQQGGSHAIISAEGVFISNMGGRYDSKGRPNLEAVLSGHAAEACRVNRQGKDPLFIKEFRLTLVQAVQPSVVTELGKIEGAMSRGLTARILPFIPRDNVGYRKILESSPLTPNTKQHWHDLVTRLLERPRPLDGELLQLQFSAEARSRFLHLRQAVERYIPESGMRDWMGKFPGAIQRLAGIFHVASHECPEEHLISDETLHRAIRMGLFLKAHAEVMFQIIGRRAGYDEAAQVLATLRTVGKEYVTRRELHQKMKGRVAFKRQSDFDLPIDILIEYGWLKELPYEGGGKGRPSAVLAVHPNALGLRRDPQSLEDLLSFEDFEDVSGADPETEFTDPTVELLTMATGKSLAATLAGVA